MNRVVGLVVALLSGCAGVQHLPPGAVSGAAGIDVERYELTLELDHPQKSIRGELMVALTLTTDGATITLDADDALTIDSVQLGGHGALEHRRRPDQLEISLPHPARRGDRLVLTIVYQGQPARGLHFFEGGAYTAFHTEGWMPCHADPADKARMVLHAVAKPGGTLVGPGAAQPSPTLDDRQLWDTVLPMSAYLYNFAHLHNPVDVEQHPDHGPALTFTALAPLPVPQVNALRDATRHALTVYERWSGLPYSYPEYRQVFLPGGIEQESVAMALESAGAVEDFAKDGREDWFILHELSHQWWGNRVTCRSWSDFWLNEGFAVYLAAAVHDGSLESPPKEDRTEFERELALARRRYARARAQGKDRPLSTNAWKKPEDMSGPIPYAKGPLVLHFLRAQLGDAAFFAGLKRYTQAHDLGTVTSADLQHAMESASGRSLENFFRYWVDGGEAPDLQAMHTLAGARVHLAVIDRNPKTQQARYSIPVAIESATGRTTARLEMADGRGEIELPVSGDLRAVRVDDRGTLPWPVVHPRPPAMLGYQLAHEPDVLGRAEALDALVQACRSDAAAPTCQRLPELLDERVRTDPSRLIQDRARQAIAGAP